MPEDDFAAPDSVGNLLNRPLAEKYFCLRNGGDLPGIESDESGGGIFFLLIERSLGTAFRISLVQAPI